MTPYTLAEVEQEIQETYFWFHEQNPFVKPQETGRLGDLWALHEILVDEKKAEMTQDEIAYEFGVN